MNKTQNINLGGLPFVIDEDAFIRLQAYTKAIGQKFNHVEGNDEIVADIEARLAEMMSEKLKTTGRGIISMNEVDAAIGVMGRPEEFGQESTDEETFGEAASSSSYTGTSSSTVVKKKWMRDKDRNWLGGVLAGLSAYFGIENPVWLRIAFIIGLIAGDSFLFFGSLSAIFFVGYIVMWIALPKAQTPTEKMQMRGEAVNLDNIEQNIKEEWSSVKKNGNLNTGRDFGDTLGSILKAFLKILVVFGLVIAVIVLAYLLISFIAAAFGFTVAAFGIGVFASILPNQLFESTTLKWVGVSGLMLATLAPLLFFTFLTIKLLFKTKINMPLLALGSFVGLVIGLFMAGYTTSKTFADFSQSGAVTSTQVLPLTDSTIYLTANDYWGNDGIEFFDDDITRNVDVKIYKSKDGQLRIKQRRTARGKNHAVAQGRAEQISYKYTVDSLNNIMFDPQLSFPEDGLIRIQEVDVKLEVPEGVRIVMDDDFRRVGHYRYSEGIHLMTKDGLVEIDADGNILEEADNDDDDWKNGDREDNVSIELFGKKFLDVEVMERDGEDGDAERVRITLNGEEVVEVEVDEAGDRVRVNNEWHDADEVDVDFGDDDEEYEE